MRSLPNMSVYNPGSKIEAEIATQKLFDTDGPGFIRLGKAPEDDYYKEKLNSKGFITSGVCPDNNLVEISEISDHPFMIGSQFHPEFGSRLDRPHPLFDHFIKASANQKKTGAQFQL